MMHFSGATDRGHSQEWRLARHTFISLITVLNLGLAPMVARADPNDYVLTLDFTGGEHEVEAKSGAATSARNGAPAGEAVALSWAQGVSDTWFTEAYAQFANSVAGGGGGFDSVSWENVVRFSDPGQWPVDVGALIEIERSRVAAQGWTVTAGPLFQKDVDQFQVNGNLLLQRQFDGGVHIATQLAYQMQVRYRSDPRLEFGMQALGQMGAWNHWGNPQGQVHRVGPAVFGEHRMSPTSSLHFNAAVLLGASRAAANVTLRSQVEYEF